MDTTITPPSALGVAGPGSLLPGLVFAAVLAGCGGGPSGAGGTPAPPPGPTEATTSPPVIQPGAPGQAGRVLSPEALGELTRPPHTDADVRFMQDMILHHAQALELTALVPDRSTRADVQLLARRIEVSQDSEIALMRRWLEERWEEAPDPSVHGLHHDHQRHTDMPGMLSPEQLRSLASATGDEFDQMFLEFMIFHHQGALTMVAELFASPGAGQGGDIFEFASHVDADQRIEIARMQRMLTAVP